jgi:hypothetical protein
MPTPHSTPRRTRFPRRTLLAACAAAALASCAGTSGPDRVAARITLRQFAGAGAADLELRSESHTDRVEYYSTARDGAAVKIMRDDLMEALLQGFDESGYADFARPGPGPTSGGSGVRKVVEVERDGVVTHVTSSTGAPPAQVELVAQLSTGFFAAYNAIRSYQTIDDGNDGSIFVGPGN